MRKKNVLFHFKNEWIPLLNPAFFFFYLMWLVTETNLNVASDTLKKKIMWSNGILYTFAEDHLLECLCWCFLIILSFWTSCSGPNRSENIIHFKFFYVTTGPVSFGQHHWQGSEVWISGWITGLSGCLLSVMIYSLLN